MPTDRALTATADALSAWAALPVKQRLCAVATHLFARHGYTPVSVNQICSDARVSKGAFYHHYASKDELLCGIYQPLLDLQIHNLREICAKPLPAMDRLHLAVVDLVLTAIAQLDALTVFLQSMHLLEPAMLRQVRLARRTYHELFGGLVAAAQQEGSVRRDMEPELLTHHFFGAPHYLCAWFRPDGRWTPEQVAQSYAELWFNGVRAASPN